MRRSTQTPMIKKKRKVEFKSPEENNAESFRVAREYL